jgi:hypothetical protein
VLTKRGYDAMTEYFEVTSKSIKSAALIRARQSGATPAPSEADDSASRLRACA